LDYILDQFILPRLLTEAQLLDLKGYSTAVRKLIDGWKPVIEDRLEHFYQFMGEKWLKLQKINNYLVNIQKKNYFLFYIANVKCKFLITIIKLFIN
jgi:hypothetical protein